VRTLLEAAGARGRSAKDDVLDAEVMDLQATPTYFIGNARHHGPYDAVTLIRALEASRGR